MKGNVLVIDDDVDVLLALDLLLKENGCTVTCDTDPRRIPAHMSDQRFDAVFLDMNFRREATDGAEGLRWLKEILVRDPGVMVIPVTAFGDVDLAVAAVRQGAADFVLKPWKNEKLLSTLEVALRLRQSRAEADALRGQGSQLASDLEREFGDMIGTSRAMRDVQDLIRKVAPTDANVLILGENGTGKELVARALHRGSRRAERVFLAVDVGSIMESLFESELFGHERGAFTDARDRRVGRLETATGGTVFLDEIGNLPPALQAKLLQCLEKGEVVPVGSNVPRSIDTRLISATNMPLYDMVARREFRQDLLYRINTIEISLPPLRERKEDIPLLLEHYCAVFCHKYSTGRKDIPSETMERLREYRWPGNVRELLHAVERAVIVSDSPVLRVKDLFPGEPLVDFPGGPGGAIRGRPALRDIEREAIRRCLENHGGNVSRTAGELHLTRASLYRRMRKYGLSG